MTLYEHMLYDFNMQFYTAATKTPFSGIQYFKEESEFYHPWSIKETMKIFGYNKLHEVMPLDVFVGLPMFMLDDAIDGLTKGRDARFKFDKDNKPKGQTDAPELKDVMKQLEEILTRTSVSR